VRRFNDEKTSRKTSSISENGPKEIASISAAPSRQQQQQLGVAPGQLPVSFCLLIQLCAPGRPAGRPAETITRTPIERSRYESSSHSWSLSTIYRLWGRRAVDRLVRYGDRLKSTQVGPPGTISDRQRSRWRIYSYIYQPTVFFSRKAEKGHTSRDLITFHRVDLRQHGIEKRTAVSSDVGRVGPPVRGTDAVTDNHAWLDGPASGRMAEDVPRPVTGPRPSENQPIALILSTDIGCKGWDSGAWSCSRQYVTTRREGTRTMAWYTETRDPHGPILGHPPSNASPSTVDRRWSGRRDRAACRCDVSDGAWRPAGEAELAAIIRN